MDSETDWQLSCSTIQDANLYLLKSKKFADVTFVVGKEKEAIEAHKLILMARSPFFEAMFERWETGQNSKIDVPEISGKSFQMFLQFLYGNEFVVTGNEVEEVLYLAHKYNTKELGKECSDLFKSAIDVNNAIHIYQVATKLEQEALQTESMEFILKNGEAVLEDTGFLEADVDTLRIILEDDNLATDELTVFRAVMRWAENKCEVQKIQCTSENIRDVLKNDMIHLIRFPTMSLQEFTDEVVAKNEGLLTDSETIGVYMDFTTGSPVQFQLPKLPFRRIKRLGATVYTVSPYNNVKHFQNSNCRVHREFGYPPSMCEAVFRFIPSKNIRITAIELYQQFDGLEKFLISVYPASQSTAATPTKLRPKSSTIFDLNEGLDVHKDVTYDVKLALNGTQSTVFGNRPAAGELYSSVKTNYGKKSITFSFSSPSENCYLRGRGYYDSNSRKCICNRQIKLIHFRL